MSCPAQFSDDAITALLAQYRATGDRRTLSRIVEQMRPLVHSVARKFAGRETQEDLEGEGYMGLMRAIERFAPDRGVRFSTFATHLIAGQIRHYLRDRGHLIRQPAWLQELGSRVDRVTRELEQQFQRSPTAAEIALAANVSEEGVEELLNARRTAQVIRMQSAVRQEDEEFLEVDPEKFQSQDYHTFELPLEDRIAMEGALDRLKELEQKVLEFFFYQDFNQSEIARRLGISNNYTGYLLRRGLKQLRERMEAEGVQVLDPLTQVYHGQHFTARLVEELSRAQASSEPLALTLFFLVRGCGDEQLADAAAVLRAQVRRADVVGRTGARELGVIFPRTGPVATTVG
ncbi:MAG: sigma-70 family RNA polymerase sigma factor [Armatimonadetes bacterium]|nr:sigma-70 family RNA polymerase sigma factor [Armatimonadota bacterium]